MKKKSIFSKNQIKFDGPYIISPEIFKDNRGFFYESWNQKRLSDLLNKEILFLQDNHSKSKFSVLRGMHYQVNPYPQDKLIRCTYGEIYDVFVDIRKSSKTFGKWYGVKLTAYNKLQIWLPSGFAHGFLTISSMAEVQYKTTKMHTRYGRCFIKS